MTFKHYISLGYFCSVALELERFGLRDASYPFDWIISDIKSVFECIENNFDNIFDINLLSQSQNEHKNYKNIKYGFYFFHDFNKYIPLSSQLDVVKEKYNRRIKRFYNAIKEPTLFIRYISDEKKTSDGKSEELAWIEQNIEKKTKIIKSFNSENEIIFIANEGVVSDKIKIYHITPDDNDTVARKPFNKNESLYNYFSNVDYESKIDNLRHYEAKARKKDSVFELIKKKIKKTMTKEYIHCSQYDEKGK